MKVKLMSALILMMGLSMGCVSCNNDSDDKSEDTKKDAQMNVQKDGNGEGQLRIMEEQIKPFVKRIKADVEREVDAVDAAEIEQFVKGQYDLNFELLRGLSEQVQGNNAMISTFSLQMALAMTWAGAVSTTADEIKSVLHFNDNTHHILNALEAKVMAGKMAAVDDDNEGHWDAIDINISNDLYVSSDKYTWNSSWLQVLAQNYGAGIMETDFMSEPEGAREYINEVVSKDTHERILELLPENSITFETMAVLTNAIYFKAPWAEAFDKHDEKQSFKLSDGTEKQVAYLYSKKERKYVKTDQYEAVSVPLRESKYGMMFILPEEGEFESVLTALDGDEVSRMFDSMVSKRVYLEIPAYSYSTSVSLKEPLQKLGMVNGFKHGVKEFSGMTEEENDFYIDEIYHKTFIGLDEKGIEASAATAVVMKERSVAVEDEDKYAEMLLNRPYFYILYESETRTPLFVGRVMDPTVD